MKQPEADTLKGIIDLMVGSNAYDCIKSHANVIKAKNEQIEHLKGEVTTMADIINDLRETKIHYEAVIDCLKSKLKPEPEIEKSCETCEDKCPGFEAFSECFINGFAHWT